MTEAKPPMPDRLRELAVAAQARVRKLGTTAPVDDMVPRDLGGGESFRSPYASDDWELWLCLLLDTFGTRNCRVVNAFMRQLTGMIPDTWDEEGQRWVVDTDLLQLALAIICSLRPRNEAEAAIAVHCAALHLVTFKVTDRMRSQSWMDAKSASALARVTKAYTEQVQALNGLRSPKAKRQVITVKKELHQHVHYHDGRAGEGGRDSDGQPYAPKRLRAHASPAGEPIEVAALPSPNASGDALSRPCGEGQAGLSNARRRERIGRAQGGAER